MQLQLLLQQFVLPECVCRLCLPHSVYLCALHFAFAFACALLFSCFCFCFCFLSFRFVLLLCFFVVVFVLFNIIASTLVHRHTNMVTRTMRHMADRGNTSHTSHTRQHQQQQQHHFLYMYSILCTRARFFFNISAADAICLGRKLDKRLGSRSLSWLWPDWGKLISY